MRTSLVLCLCVVASILFISMTAQSDKPPAAHPPPIVLEQMDDPYVPVPARPPGRGGINGSTFSRGPWVSIQVNVDEFGNNIPGDAANEPSIAIDPTDPDIIVIGWRQFDTVASNFRQAGWAYSHDGGQTWTFPGVLEPGVFRSDPVLNFDADGNIYYNSLHTNFGDVWRCDIFKSTDGGVSWSKAMFAFGGDKCWMAIDRTGGIGHGNIYEAWNTAGNVYFPSTFSRSTDGGLSWLEPIEIPNRPVFGTVEVGPDGELYVAGVPNSSFTFTFWVLNSTNAQDPQAFPTFDQVVQVDMGGALVIGEAPNPAGLMGQVWAATDHSEGPSRGNVYVLCSVDPLGNPFFNDPMDVKFIRSTNGGQTWSPPVRVNDDPIDNEAWQWFGTMSVAPNGRIDVIWNDTRNSGVDNISELYYAYSTNAGQSWSMNIPVSPAFDSHVGWPHQNKIGDYYDMISDVAGARVAYAATFNDEQDVYFLRLGDCNNNGIHDGEEIAGGASDDNGNNIPDDCEPSGACCMGDGGCTGSQLEEVCLAAGGLYRGDGSDCALVDCPQPMPTGACCLSEEDCLELSVSACADQGGEYAGDGTVCNPDPCSLPCPEDLDGDGAVGPFDLAVLLGAWGPCE